MRPYDPKKIINSTPSTMVLEYHAVKLAYSMIMHGKEDQYLFKNNQKNNESDSKAIQMRS